MLFGFLLGVAASAVAYYFYPNTISAAYTWAKGLVQNLFKKKS